MRNVSGPKSHELFTREQRHMAPGLQSIALYSELAITEARGVRLIDADGSSYIDFSAGVGVGSVGYGHPHYVATLKAQLDRVTFGSFTTEARVRFLERLTALTPPGLDRVQLYSGGAEAVEAAFRLAKSATKKFEFIAFWGGFHGKSGGVLGLLGGPFKQHQGPYAPGLHLSPYANCYRCPFNLRHPECGLACAEHLRQVIHYDTEGEIAAIIIEPMQGTAGNVIPPPGFLPAIKAIAKDNQALFIADEMLTGFGRSGRMWGCDHSGVVPDLITMGKGIGGGFPMSGLAATKDLAAAKPFANPSGSSSSYGGNPLAGAAGLAALEIIEQEGLVANSRRVGAAMLARLEKLKEKYRCVGDVRGLGLMLGIDLVADRDTKEALASDVTRALFEECLRRGLVSMCYGSTVRINPPLVIDEATALEGLDIFDEALGVVVERFGLD